MSVLARVTDENIAHCANFAQRKVRLPKMFNERLRAFLYLIAKNKIKGAMMPCSLMRIGNLCTVFIVVENYRNAPLHGVGLASLAPCDVPRAVPNADHFIACDRGNGSLNLSIGLRKSLDVIRMSPVSLRGLCQEIKTVQHSSIPILRPQVSPFLFGGVSLCILY